ncbi:MAG: T9SS type A sorting domain-containing protein [Candidatus Bipolaricaulia bacterium]
MGERNTTMTRYLKSFLQLSVALLALVAFAAGPAMGQVYYDPSEGGTNGAANAGSSAGNPYFTAQLQTAIEDALDQGVKLVVISSGDADSQAGVSEYRLENSSSVPGDLELEGQDANGNEQEVTLTLDNSLDIIEQTLTLDGVTVEFPDLPSKQIALQAGDASSSSPFEASVQYEDGTADGDQGAISFTGDNFIEMKDGPLADEDILNIDSLNVASGVTVGFDNGSNATASDRLKINDGLNVAGTLDMDAEDGFPGILDYTDRDAATSGTQVMQTDGPKNPTFKVSGEVTDGNLFVTRLYSTASSSPSFTFEGQGDLALPVEYQEFNATQAGDAPEATFEQTLIGSTGQSEIATANDVGTVRFPFLKQINGTLAVENAAPGGAMTNVLFGDTAEPGSSEFTGESTSLNVGNDLLVEDDNSRIETASNLDITVNGEFDLLGNVGTGTTEALFGHTSEFGKEVLVDGGGNAKATFQNKATFGGDVSLVAGSMEFDANSGNFSGTISSVVTGTFSNDGGTVVLETGSTHNLTFLGDVKVNGSPSFEQLPDTGSPTADDTEFIFAGTSGQQTITGSSALAAERITIDNPDGVTIDKNSGAEVLMRSSTITTAASSFPGGVVQAHLNVQSGAFTTNGGLGLANTSNAERYELTLNKPGGELREGDSNSILDNTDIPYVVDGDVAEDPYRIEYIGDASAPTADELLQQGVDAEERQVEQLSINMDVPNATISLGSSDYAAVDRFELLGGRFALTANNELRLHCQLTLERAAGNFEIPNPVNPSDAIVFPDQNFTSPSAPGDCGSFADGTDGIYLQYTNNTRESANVDPVEITTSIEFPVVANSSREDDVILDVEIDDADVTLEDRTSKFGSDEVTYRFAQDFALSSTLDLNGQRLQMNTVDGAGPNFAGPVTGISYEVALDGSGVSSPGHLLTVASEGEFQSTSSSVLEYIGAGQANTTLIDNTNDSPDGEVFTFPEVIVDKDLKESLPEDATNEGDRRVVFSTADTDDENVDGFEFDGDFTIENAQNFGDTNGDGKADLQDGVTFAGTEATGGDGNDRDQVDAVQVRGTFEQGVNDGESFDGGSLMAFHNEPGIAASEFTVDEDFVKNASDSTRFLVGDSTGTENSGNIGNVADFTVGTSNNELRQENGTFFVNASQTFVVNGAVENNSDDSRTTDVDLGSTGGTSTFTSEAFEVKGWNNDLFTGSPEDGFTDDRTRATVTGDVTQTAGTMLWRGFTEDTDGDQTTEVADSHINVQGDFNHNGGETFLKNTLLALIEGEVAVTDSLFKANLGGISEPTTGGVSTDSNVDVDSSASHDNRFRAGTLTVGTQASASTTSKSHGSPASATFEASFRDDPTRASGELIDPPSKPEANDRVLLLSGDTRINYDGRYELEGFEHRQSTGGYYLLGLADYHPETDDPSDDLDITDRREFDAGQCGLVRFTGKNIQTLKTDGTAETFLNSLSVRSPSDEEPISSGVQLKSDVALNQVRCVDAEREIKNGVLSSTSPVRGDAVFRPFGTYFAERGVLRTFEGGTAKNHGGTHHELFVLTAKPTDNRDLTEANSADEDRAGVFAATSPVLFGDERAYISGTMTRAIEDQSEDTGGRLADGYIFPMGSSPVDVVEAEQRDNLQLLEPEYRAMVLQTVTDHTEPGFFSVTAAPKPVDDSGNVIELPDGLTDDGLTRQNDRIELDLNTLSLPYMKVDFNRPNNFKTFNMRMISDIGDVRGTKVDQVKQMRIVQREKDNTSSSNWQLAGDYDEDAGGGLLDDDPDDAGGPNETISGKTNVVHEGVNLDRGQILAFASDDSLNNIGQTDAPLVELSSGQSSPVGVVDVGNETDISFNISDPDTDPSNFSFSVTGSSNSAIEPDSVSFQSDGTVTYAPDSSAAKASFETSSQSFKALTLEIRVEDPDGNSDVASVGVQVGLQDGDADMDGLAPSESTPEAAQDAELALEEFLKGADVSTPSVLADVAFFDGADIAPSGGDDRVTPFDAAQILGLAFSSSSSALAKDDAPASEGEIIVTDAENGTVSVRLSDDANGVYSAAVNLKLDPAQQSVSGVSSDLPDGWIVDHVTRKDGTVRIGLAGRTPLSGGQEVATIQLGGAKSGTGALKPEGTFRLNGSSAKDVRVDVAPDEFALEGNYPNPFSRSTTIKYQLSEPADVTLEVYDMLGRKVKTLVDQRQSSGTHEVRLDRSTTSEGLSSGVYIYRIEAGDFQDTGKMTVVK